MKTKEELEQDVIKYYSSDMWFDKIFDNCIELSQSYGVMSSNDISEILLKISAFVKTPEYINYKSEQLLFITKIFDLTYNNNKPSFPLISMKISKVFDKENLPYLMENLEILMKEFSYNFSLAKSIFNLEDLSFSEALKIQKSFDKVISAPDIEIATVKFIKSLYDIVGDNKIIWDEVVKGTLYNHFRLNEEKISSNKWSPYRIGFDSILKEIYKQRAEKLLKPSEILKRNNIKEYIDSLTSFEREELDKIYLLFKYADNKDTDILCKSIIEKILYNDGSFSDVLNAVRYNLFMKISPENKKDFFEESFKKNLFSTLYKKNLKLKDEEGFFMSKKYAVSKYFISELDLLMFMDEYKDLKNATFYKSFEENFDENIFNFDKVKSKTFNFDLSLEDPELQRKQASYLKAISFLNEITDLSEKLSLEVKENSLLVTLIDKDVKLIDEKEIQEIIAKSIKIRLEYPLTRDLDKDELKNIYQDIILMIHEHTLGLKFEEQKNNSSGNIVRKKV